MAVITNIPEVLSVLAFLLALGSTIPTPNARSSECSGGVQFYPDPNDCNAYFQCANGNPVQLHCAAGLHWNNKAIACDYPANAGCVLGGKGDESEEDSGDSSKSSGDASTSEESVPGSKSSSSESSECPEDNKPPKCPSVDPALSVFFPHPDPHWFYHCSNGVAYCKVCPSPLVWNTNCDTCDWEGQDNCPKESSESGDSSKSSGDASTSEESVPGSDSSSSESEPSKPPPKPTSSESGDSSKSSGDDSTSEESVPGSKSSSSESNECPDDNKPPTCPSDDPALSVFFPHPDPHWFYHCSNGVAYCKPCPSPLVWNSKCDTCDWEGQDNCPKESSESGDSSKSSGDASTSEESVPGSESSSSESEPSKPPPKPTSSESGDSSKSSGDDSTSEESVPGSKSSSSESNECPDDNKPPKCPSVDPTLSVFFPHPDPHWFYHCSNGVAYCKPCPSPLVWNSKCDTCDWEGQDNCPKESSESGDSSKSSGDASTSEESVPGSESSSSESEPSKPPPKPTSSESGDSSKSSGDDSTSEESVPGSKSSSSESNECPEDSKPPKCPSVDPALSVFFPHPDPHWFYHCSNGVAYCKACPASLVWNAECDTCDWEGQNNCPSSESGDSSKSSGDASTSEESVPGSESSSEE